MNISTVAGDPGDSKPTRRRRARTLLTRLVASAATAGAVLPLGLAAGAPAAHAASAGQTVTYGATVTIPAPPSSNFSGASAGGDGWAVALSATQLFNVFHHSPTLMVNCHNQADASACWSSYKTITDSSGNNFSTSGQPGMYIDQNTGRLYVFATRTSDYTAGVVCVDTTQPASATDPFCGFTALSAVGDAPDSQLGFSGISDPVMVGHDWYAFNFVPGTPTGTEDQLLCFDTSTDAACASQPFAIDYGGGTVGFASPAPGIMAMNSDVVLQVPTGSGYAMACLDTTTDASCTGSWPAGAANPFAGDPVPMLSAGGAVTGVCTTTSTPDCFDTSGAKATAPAGLASIFGNSGWNGGAVTLGSRIYVPDGNTNAVNCYDFSTSASCANFPKSFTNLGLLYTVNSDPQRPTCLWVNSDDGTSQIQNFDAYTGGTCAQAPLRVQASSVVATDNSVCVPASWTSLQVQDPPPSAYTSGTVDFDDNDGNAIPGVATHNLDATGATSLTDLNLPSTDALPQFVVSLAGLTGSPSTVQVHLTWSGTYDAACVQGATAVTTATAPGQPAAPTVTPHDGAATVTWTAPTSDGYSPITGYTVTAYDAKGNSAGTCSTDGKGTSCQVTGLTDGDPYTFSVAAANAVGSTASSASLPVVPSRPSVASATTPAATVGGAYSTKLTGNGGTDPYTWAVTSGSLPAGLELASDGTVSGTPTAAGTSTFTVQITDADGATATRQITLTVNPAPQLPAGGTTALASSGASVDTGLTASGGSGPFTWTVVDGALPPGLHLDPSSGVIKGSSTVPGTYTVRVKVTDANGVSSLETVTMKVQDSNLNSRPIASTPDGRGYWVTSPQGGVDSFGDAQNYGSLAGRPLTAPVVGIEASPTGHGYWLVGADGGVFTFGDAGFYGSASGYHVAGAVRGLIPTTDGHGYWLVAADGGVFSFGDAGFYGSAAGARLASPVVGMLASPDDHGYWLVAADGGVFNYGDAAFHGSAAGVRLVAPIVGIAGTPDGGGYRLVGADGGVFSFGDAGFYGSASAIHLAAPIDGIQSTPDGNGYWLVGTDGGVFSFGDAGFTGSVPGLGGTYS